MFERFTDPARKVMALANQEATHFNHQYIGTEHILLGIVKEGSSVGANVLKSHHVDLSKARAEVAKLIKSGPDRVQTGKLPQTPRVMMVLEYAIEEARNLDHNCVGTEHLLLGLIREGDGVAAQVLLNLGLKLEEVRAQVLNLLESLRTPCQRRTAARLTPASALRHVYCLVYLQVIIGAGLMAAMIPGWLRDGWVALGAGPLLFGLGIVNWLYLRRYQNFVKP